MREEAVRIALGADARYFHVLGAHASLAQRLTIGLPQIELSRGDQLGPIGEHLDHLGPDRIATRADGWPDPCHEISGVGSERVAQGCHRGASSADGAAAPTRVYQADNAALGIGKQHWRTVGKAQHQRLVGRPGDQNIATRAGLRISFDRRHGAPVDLMGGKQIRFAYPNGFRNPTEILVDVLGRVADRVADVERLAALNTHPTRARGDGVDDAWYQRQVFEREELQAHAAEPASRAASTTAAAFGGRSSMGISWPPSPRARPNSCFRYHSGTPVETSDHGMMPLGSIEPR